MAEPRRSSAEMQEPRYDDLEGARILIVEARFYEDIADALLAGATRALEEAWRRPRSAISVPGSLEIAPAIAMAVDAAERSGKPYEGAVALGCVIRGETLHFEIVSQELARALLDLVGRAPHPDRQRHPHRRHRRPGLGARPPGRGRQGRRRCARGAFARSAQAPPRRGLTMAVAGARRTSARPIAAAPLGWRPCRRSTRWTSPAPASTTSSPSSRAIGSAARSRARSTCRRRRPSSATWYRAWCASSAALDPLIDEALARRLAAQAHRGDPARGAARWRLRARSSQRRAGARRGVRICRRRQRLRRQGRDRHGQCRARSDCAAIAGGEFERSRVMHGPALGLSRSRNGSATGLRKFDDEFQASWSTVRW